ncbi:MAG: winged helix-turn-helix transcriptional regulator [Oscillospiraceae bacterium]|nr:winged helix-turn-helix transcriptional regulator [Oscillospiraceae bacterium]
MRFYDMELDRSDCTVIHQEVVDRVRTQMPEDEVLLDLADSFKLFSDSTRLKILYALMEAEMCVCDISVLLGMSKSSVSHQLRVLKQSNLVKYRKAGRVIYYSLADEHVRTICRMGMEHVTEEETAVGSAVDLQLKED